MHKVKPAQPPPPFPSLFLSPSLPSYKGKLICSFPFRSVNCFYCCWNWNSHFLQIHGYISCVLVYEHVCVCKSVCVWKERKSVGTEKQKQNKKKRETCLFFFKCCKPNTVSECVRVCVCGQFKQTKKEHPHLIFLPIPHPARTS